MKTSLSRLLTASALLALSVSPALAHRFWIIPSTSVLSGDDQWVTFDAAISNNPKSARLFRRSFFPSNRIFNLRTDPPVLGAEWRVAGLWLSNRAAA